LSEIMVARWPALLLVGCVGCAAAEANVVEGSSDLTSADPIEALRAAVQDVDAPRVALAGLATPAADLTDGTRGELVSLSEIDWHQKWPGGRSADHAWERGGEAARRCAWASLLRFEAIFAAPPAELVALRTRVRSWSGVFHNWNDDYSGASGKGQPAYGDAKGARIVATRDDLAKWVSATAKDGSCFVPTRKMVADWAAACAAQATETGGIKGCEAR